MSDPTAYTFRDIPHGGPLYVDTILLRDLVLREPLGLAFSPEALGREASDYHLVSQDVSGRVVACLVLTPEGHDAVRMRQVAVAPDCQRLGIGTLLVEYSETFARNAGFQIMTLHARESAVPFYLGLGYERVGDRFEEVTMPHWRMQKRLR
jgi:N-acetylglutamate synthase-like GNAT family acetyltransferase